MTEGVGAAVLELVANLQEIGSGECAVIPDTVATSVRASGGPGTRVPNRWFYPLRDSSELPTTTKDNTHVDTVSEEGTTSEGREYKVKDIEMEVFYQHRMLYEIWESSKRCERELEHEPGWNDGVHSRIISEALRGQPSVRHRNMYVPAPFDPDTSLSLMKGFGRVFYTLIRSTVSPG